MGLSGLPTPTLKSLLRHNQLLTPPTFYFTFHRCSLHETRAFPFGLFLREPGICLFIPTSYIRCSLMIVSVETLFCLYLIYEVLFQIFISFLILLLLMIFSVPLSISAVFVIPPTETTPNLSSAKRVWDFVTDLPSLRLCSAVVGQCSMCSLRCHRYILFQPVLPNCGSRFFCLG